MALIDFFKRLKKNSGIEFEVETEVVQPPRKEEKPKVVPLSMGELDNVKWEELASKLKAERILPPSYDKKPVRIKITLSKSGDPMAELEFRSTTSDSYRVLRITENQVYESVNSPVGFLSNTEMTDVWKKFRDDVKQKNALNQRFEIYGFKEQRKNLKRELDNLSKLDDLFEREAEFLDKYKNTRFASFGEYFDENYLPTFVVDQGEEIDLDAEMVTPFTPKTLEFCVSKLTAEAKLQEASVMNVFVEKCNELQTASIYKTGNWDKTIKKLVQVLSELEPQKTSVYIGAERNGVVQISEINPKNNE